VTEHIPLYPDEAMIALLVLGPKRAKEWSRIAVHLENKHGLIRVDGEMGGRYWPAVVAFFRQRHNMDLVDSAGRAGVSSRVRIVPPPPDSL
jgi:hypothetical protein